MAKALIRTVFVLVIDFGIGLSIAKISHFRCFRVQSVSTPKPEAPTPRE